MKWFLLLAWSIIVPALSAQIPVSYDQHCVLYRYIENHFRGTEPPVLPDWKAENAEISIRGNHLVVRTNEDKPVRLIYRGKDTLDFRVVRLPDPVITPRIHYTEIKNDTIYVGEKYAHDIILVPQMENLPYDIYVAIHHFDVIVYDTNGNKKEWPDVKPGSSPAPEYLNNADLLILKNITISMPGAEVRDLGDRVFVVRYSP